MANVLAQNIPICPSLSVTGPAGVPDPGETAFFIVNIEDPDPKWKLSYEWTSSGEIRGGQGTTRIEVLFSQNVDQLTATVEIVGLPDGCVSVSSETLPCCPTPAAELLFEFSGPLTTDSLKSIQVEFKKKSETVQFYVFLPGSKDAHSESTRDTLNVLRSVFQERGIFVFTESDDCPVKIFVVPPGAPNPQP